MILNPFTVSDTYGIIFKNNCSHVVAADLYVITVFAQEGIIVIDVDVIPSRTFIFRLEEWMVLWMWKHKIKLGGRMMNSRYRILITRGTITGRENAACFPIDCAYVTLSSIDELFLHFWQLISERGDKFFSLTKLRNYEIRIESCAPVK